jgi:hypothetical protein
MGIKNGGVVKVEEREGRITLSPAADIEMYSDEDIKRWQEEDRMSPAERKRLLARIARLKG